MNAPDFSAASCSASWVPIDIPPTKAGQYIVGNTSHGYAGQARWMPKKAEWKFPAAQSSFTPDVWTVFPSLPNRESDELKGRNAFLTDIINRARTKFCEDGSDGAIAAEMFRILGEASKPKP